jgi:hypothetical protein
VSGRCLQYAWIGSIVPATKLYSPNWAPSAPVLQLIPSDGRTPSQDTVSFAAGVTPSPVYTSGEPSKSSIAPPESRS